MLSPVIALGATVTLLAAIDAAVASRSRRRWLRVAAATLDALLTILALLATLTRRCHKRS